ncbi:MAG: sigma-54-dependent Fis family transcriptional regulator [Kiritimatiellae bacterium]|nr:sigma-54-dependent Fis family transcriptional regulator [Kiritimatiellia bacterium]
MAKILIIDDEPSILNVLHTLLQSNGHEPIPARGGEQAKEMIANDTYDLMISDIRMEPIDGMELLRFAKEEHPEMPVIMLTAFGSVETAVAAMKEGAYDYVTKPFKVDELVITIDRALEYSSVMTENKSLREQLSQSFKFDNMVAESPAMRRVCTMIERVAPTDSTVLIYGESGTGKELVAKSIHAFSARKHKKYLPINCAALPEPLLESELFGHVKGSFTGASNNKDGLFEVANGGTIFLDEIGSMPMSIQAKLLRVLQDHQIRRVGGTENIQVNVRVVAATNDRLEKLIEEGKFREDLYYRLSVIPLEVPPLRDRPEDVMPMVEFFLRKLMGDDQELPEIDSDTQMILEQYNWPGNVRELENALRHAITFMAENVITPAVLPARITRFNPGASGAMGGSGFPDPDMSGKSLKAFTRAKEVKYIKYILEQVGDDKEKAAQKLKVSLATLYRKLPEPSE